MVVTGLVSHTVVERVVGAAAHMVGVAAAAAVVEEALVGPHVPGVWQHHCLGPEVLLLVLVEVVQVGELN